MMNNGQAPPPPNPPNPVINPVPKRTINLLGLGYLLLSVLFFYLLVTTWPVLDLEHTAFRPVNIFGWTHSWSPDRHLLVTVMISGGIGSLAHTLTSFSDYVGNRQLSSDWLWFLALRTPVGIALAVLFYLIIRGGVLIPTIQVNPDHANFTDTTLKANPYALAGFSALAGMFAKQATDKLALVFDAMFKMRTGVDRSDPLGSGGGQQGGGGQPPG